MCRNWERSAAYESGSFPVQFIVVPCFAVCDRCQSQRGKCMEGKCRCRSATSVSHHFRWIAAVHKLLANAPSNESRQQHSVGLEFNHFSMWNQKSGRIFVRKMRLLVIILELPWSSDYTRNRVLFGCRCCCCSRETSDESLDEGNLMSCIHAHANEKKAHTFSFARLSYGRRKFCRARVVWLRRKCVRGLATGIAFVGSVARVNRAWLKLDPIFIEKEHRGLCFVIGFGQCVFAGDSCSPWANIAALFAIARAVSFQRARLYG